MTIESELDVQSRVDTWQGATSKSCNICYLLHSTFTDATARSWRKQCNKVVTCWGNYYWWGEMLPEDGLLSLSQFGVPQIPLLCRLWLNSYIQLHVCASVDHKGSHCSVQARIPGVNVVIITWSLTGFPPKTWPNVNPRKSWGTTSKNWTRLFWWRWKKFPVFWSELDH